MLERRILVHSEIVQNGTSRPGGIGVILLAAMSASPATAVSARNRRYKRVPAGNEFLVTWQCPGVREACPGTNLNMGGVFLLTKNAKEVGTTLKLKVPNPGGDILVNGIVRDASNDGMGVEFVAIGNKERAKLDLLVKRLLLAEQDADDAPIRSAGKSVAPSTAASEAAKKRRFGRLHLPKGLKVAWIYGKQREVTVAGTVSVGGLFVISQQPAPVGSTIRLLFDIPGGEILATATVRNHIAARGMGVEFSEIREEDRKRLDQLMKRLLS